MWIWIGFILALLLLIFAVILSSMIIVEIRVRKHNKNDTIRVYINLLYGFIKLKYEVPIIVFQNLQEGFKVRSEQSDNWLKGHTAEKNEGINKRRVKRWIAKYKDLLEVTPDLIEWSRNTMSHFRVRNLDWSTNVALNDAAHTATLTGLLWALKSSVIGLLTHHLHFMRRPELFVVPLFGSKPQFTTELVCIGEIRCGYALYAGLVLIVRVLRVKGGVNKWQSILFKG